MRIRYITTLTVLLASVASAATILSISPPADLIGGTVTVTRFGGGMNSATFVAGPGGSAVASTVGSASFNLTVTFGGGDTAFSIWTLTNTDASAIMFNRIVAVSIDLTLSGTSLFDDGSTPSTPGSLAGVLGVTPVAGIGISSAVEVNPWTDPLNTGDMFTATNIVFGGGFTAGAASSWMDDTDRISGVPEPAPIALVAGPLLLLLLRRARPAV